MPLLGGGKESMLEWLRLLFALPEGKMAQDFIYLHLISIAIKMMLEFLNLWYRN